MKPCLSSTHVTEEANSSDSAPCVEEEILVIRARSGDMDAFAELMRRHRAQAVGWVNSMINDQHMSEDVVQEAMSKAFLHMGSLMDSRRFTPWLYRIVRNQAYLKLRRGGPFAKERPFASFGKVNYTRTGPYSVEMD